MYAALDNNTMTSGYGSVPEDAYKELSLDELLYLESDGDESEAQYAATEIERRTDAENEQDLAAFEDAESS